MTSNEINLAIEFIRQVIQGTEWENKVYLAGGAVRDELIGNKIKDIDLFFYDGDHAKDKTAAAVRYFSSCFADTAILIFDDANWEGIVQGAIEGLEQTDLEVIYEKKLLNEVESKQDWWNGLYIVVVKRKGE